MTSVITHALPEPSHLHPRVGHTAHLRAARAATLNSILNLHVHLHLIHELQPKCGSGSPCSSISGGPSNAKEAGRSGGRKKMEVTYFTLTKRVGR